MKTLLLKTIIHEEWDTTGIEYFAIEIDRKFARKILTRMDASGEMSRRDRAFHEMMFGDHKRGKFFGDDQLPEAVKAKAELMDVDEWIALDLDISAIEEPEKRYTCWMIVDNHEVYWRGGMNNGTDVWTACIEREAVESIAIGKPLSQ